MNEFNKLRELIASLSEIEIKFARRNFKQFVAGGTDTNLIILFNILLKDSSIEYKVVCKQLYGIENKPAFKKLAQRLTDKILDVLISKDLLLNENNHSERNRELFQIKRRFLYYDILSVHGLNNLALNSLNQIIKSAKELEYYDYLLIALNTKLVRLSRRSGMIKFSKIHEEIEFYSRCSIALNKANYLLAYYTSLKNSGEEYTSQYDLTSEIQTLELDCNFTKSNRIRSALYYLIGIQFSNLKQFEDAKTNFYNFYAHLKKRSNKQSKNNDLLSCLLNISEFEIKTYEFRKALFYFEEIDKLKVVNKFNLDIINEMKFLCFLSLGEISMAQKYLKCLKQNLDEFDHSLFYNDRISYYNGMIAFFNQEFKSCSNYLFAIKKIDKINADWNLCQRILLIMSYVESGKSSLADSSIENLRKYLNGKGGESVLADKFRMIYKILIILSKFGFDFKRTAIQCGSQLDLVDSNSIDNYFDYRSPYLIPFTSWFKSKLKNVPYDHSAAMKEMRRKYKAEQSELV